MDLNHLPTIDWSKSQPGCCCPEFNPAEWESLELHFRDKAFVRAHTRSFLHIPLNIGSVFARTWNAIKSAHADEQEFVVMSDDSGTWHGEHFFNVSHEVEGADNVRLSGDYLTHVFEGPFSHSPRWVGEMKNIVEARGQTMGRLFFYYTTCPKCAKARGKNYVVAIAELTATTH